VTASAATIHDACAVYLPHALSDIVGRIIHRAAAQIPARMRSSEAAPGLTTLSHAAKSQTCRSPPTTTFNQRSPGAPPSSSARALLAKFAASALSFSTPGGEATILLASEPNLSTFVTLWSFEDVSLKAKLNFA